MPDVTDLAAVLGVPGLCGLVMRVPARRHRVPQSSVRSFSSGRSEPVACTSWASRPAPRGPDRPASPQPLMDLGGRADRFKFLIRVRGDKFTKTFDEVFAVNGVRIIGSPVRPPRANSFAERYAGTLRRECLNHLLIHGERHLREVLIEYAQHYNEHRPHQARGQRAPLYEPGEAIDLTARIKRRKAVQALISEYRRAVEQSCKTPGQNQGTSFGPAQGGHRVARRRAAYLSARSGIRPGTAQLPRQVVRA